MTTMVRKFHANITRFLVSIETREKKFSGQSLVLGFLFFFASRFAVTLATFARFLVSIPFYVAWSPMKTFDQLAPRAADGTYLASYRTHLRERSFSAAAVTLIVLFAAIKVISVMIVADLFFVSSVPNVRATTTILNPSWDRTVVKETIVNDSPDCGLTAPAYSCLGLTATQSAAGIHETNVGCDPERTTTDYRTGMRFDLSGIPDNATITDVSLNVTVGTSTASTITILRTAVDDPSGSNCGSSAGAGMYSRLGTGTTYVTASDWNTTGSKTYDLGATADSDIQARLAAGDAVTIATVASTVPEGWYWSGDNATSKPQLTITYTEPAPPPAPTSFNHSGNTTSAITWTWTDNASDETSNVIHDSGHVVKCTADAVSGTGSTGTCQETPLSANTQYTRHVNAVNGGGNTDSSGASAYTSIESPTGVNFDVVTATSLTVSAAGTISNIASGLSGIDCQESVTGTNSGWLQTNSWLTSGLTANTQYSVQCKARNGDGDETSLTSAATKYTLAAAPAAIANRAASTWYTSGGFRFSNSAWGPGTFDYLRYVFVQQENYTFTGSESTWSGLDEYCPGGACTVSDLNLYLTPTANGQDWYLHLQPVNGNGVAGTVQRLGPFWYDASAPTISGVGATSDRTTLTVSWTTNDLATTQVEYGTSESYGTLTTLDATLAASHAVTIEGLTPGTRYYYRARSRDAAGNERVSAGAFQATAPPDATVLSGIAAATTTSTATVTWTTSLAADAHLEYGTTDSYGLLAEDAAQATNHRIELTALQSGTLYHFRISGTDVNGQMFASGDQTFATVAETAEANPPATPVVSTPTAGAVVFDRRPVIAGTADPGVTIKAVIDGKVTVSAASDTNGSFSLRPIVPLALGDHKFVASAINSAGDTSSTTKSRAFAIAATSTPKTIASAVVTKKTTTPRITVTGKAPVTGTVRILLNEKTVKILRVSKGKQFSYTLVTSKTLKPGTYNVVIKILDTKNRVKQISRLTKFVKRPAAHQSDQDTEIQVSSLGISPPLPVQGWEHKIPPSQRPFMQ